MSQGMLQNPSAALMVLGGRNLLHVFADAAAANLLDFLNHIQLDAVLVDDIAVRVGHGDHLRTQLLGLLSGVDGDVARAGDDGGLADEVVVCHVGEHLAHKVQQSVAGGLGADERAAVGEALAGQHAGKLIAHPLVLAEEIADFTRAHADVAGGNVGLGADVAGKLGHKALAEPHDLGVGFALGVKVAAALAAAHRQAGQAVFEGLLEGKELDDRQVDARVQAKAALVRADGGVKLHAPAAVDMGFALVVLPGDAELHGALRLHQALQQSGGLILGVAADDRLQGTQHLVDGV